MQFIHKKTGKRYWVINAKARDCTNSRDGLAVVVYCRGDERDVTSNDWFVRDASEFCEKFEPIDSDSEALHAKLQSLVQTGRDLGVVDRKSVMTSKHDPVSETEKAAQDEAARMRESWDTFGDLCGKSRWFVATPEVEMDASGQVVWRCPVAGCGGEMKYAGVDWPTGVPGHHHQCDSCGFTAAIKGAIFGDQTDG